MRMNLLAKKNTANNKIKILNFAFTPMVIIKKEVPQNANSIDDLKKTEIIVINVKLKS